MRTTHTRVILGLAVLLCLTGWVALRVPGPTRSVVRAEAVKAKRAALARASASKKTHPAPATPRAVTAASSASAVAATGPAAGLTPEVYPAVKFAESAPVRSFPPAAPEPGKSSKRQRSVEEREVPNKPIRQADPQQPGSRDPLVHPSPAGPNLIPSPALTFEGLNNDDNFAAFGFRIIPPDTNMDVGPSHIVQAVNLLVRVYDKAGNPLTAPFKISSLFAPLGGVAAMFDDGDPIVLYDPLANRWLISQFVLPNFPSPPYHQVIAISKTGDPAGAYYLYDFVMPGNNLNDYPHFGVWPDGYYMTDNQFLNGFIFNGSGAFAFDRAKMLVGDPTASFIYFNLALLDAGIAGGLPSDFDGLTPPPMGAPNVFAYLTADEFGDAMDGLRLFNFHADFNNPSASSFTERPESPLAVAPFNPIAPGGQDNIPQPPPATDDAKLDAITDRLMHRLQYRNRGAFESLVVNHTVDADPSSGFKAGVRYYELRRPLPVGNYTVSEQSTFSPDADNRWMGSAAVDNQGNLAVGYSVSSLTTFPSIRYAGRLVSDPPGGLFQGEATLVGGTGVQTSPTSRWGDYSMLAVDPEDDCTFWYTNEYYTAASQATSSRGWVTRVGKFKFPSCLPPLAGTLQGVITNCATAGPIAGALVQVSNGFSTVTLATGAYSIKLPPGVYTVTASASGYQSASTTVVITNGGTTVANLCLVAMPIIMAAGAEITAESCKPANGAIDPGETVTVNLSLKNTGAADTNNLVATLQPTGGVLSPSGPQNYGMLIAGGPAVSKPFSFTADPALGCGATLTVTLSLKDGATDLGTVTFVFQTGTVRVILSENFDAVAPPSLPTGWTATLINGGIGTCGADGTPFPAAWVTTNTVADTPPNSAFAPDVTCVTDNRLDSPPIAVATATARLTFRNRYNLELGFDGAVLEISIAGGPFIDIIAAGGSFVTGGYTGTISSGFSSPIVGRMAWTGLSAGTSNAPGFITTTVNLPAIAAGQTVRLRWRVATDDSVVAQGSAGQWIDTVSVADGFMCTCVAPIDLQLTKVGDKSVAAAGSNLTYTLKSTNLGPGIAQNVNITDPLPTTTRFASATASAGASCTLPPAGGSGVVSCTWNGPSPPSTERTLVIVVRVCSEVACGTKISNTATTSSSTTEPNTGNNSATATTTVDAVSDLAITSTAPMPNPVAPGGSFLFTLTVNNLGPSGSVNTQVVNTLPAGFTLVSATPSVGSCTGVGTGTATCNLGTLGAAGQCATLFPTSAAITIVAVVPVNYPNIDVINTATVTSGNCPAPLSSPALKASAESRTPDAPQSPDPNPANNTVSFVISVRSQTNEPGSPFLADTPVSDQKAGSVLVYNFYSSSASNPNAENTRLNLTNTHTRLTAYVHLFFIDGSNCSVADASICLSPNQTASFLASDIDPGVSGYLVAVAVNGVTGLPAAFNSLIGDEYVKLTSGHAANLGAEAFAALTSSPAGTDTSAVTATIAFDGVGYNHAPRVLAADNLASPVDGNSTLLVVNRIGGNLAGGASAIIGPISGLLLDDNEAAFSFGSSVGSCQLRQLLSDNFPRTTPRLSVVISAGRTGWMKLWGASEVGLLGAVINRHPNAATSPAAFNQGRNLHKLTLTNAASYIIPVLAPSC